MKYLLALFFITLFGHGYTQSKTMMDRGMMKMNHNSFIENKNQWTSQVKYFLKISDQNYWIRDDGFRLDLYSQTKIEKQTQNTDENKEDSIFRFGHVWDFILLNKSEKSYFQPNDKLSYYHNYILGNDSAKWASKVGLYESITEKNIYDNIDIKYYGNQKKDLEYDFIIHPNGDYRQIQFVLKGLDGISLDSQGELQLKTSYFGNIPLSKPHTYQIIDGKKIEIQSQYIIKNDTISFLLGTYNLSYDVIIDPVVKYSTFIDCAGCSSCMNYSFDIDVNNNLEAIITGKTYYNTFPVTVGAYKSTTLANQYDIFITKLTVAGDNLLYSTFFGGTFADYGFGVAYDTSENIIFTGNTRSKDFPLKNNLYPAATSTLTSDFPFVAKLDSSGGNLIFSMVINPSTTGGGKGSGIIADKKNNIYVTGYTTSSNFPITAGAIRSTYVAQEGFLMKFDPMGTLLFSTFIGGSGTDVLRGIALDDSNNIYVIGNTTSSDFHLSATGYRKTLQGSQDAVVCKVKEDGSALLYATYIGGSTYSEYGTSIAVDGNNNTYFSGYGASTNFPTTSGSYKTTPGSGDIFVASLDPTGLNLRRSTSIGLGYSFGIDIDECGFVVISGYTGNSSFPVTTDAFKKTLQFLENVVVVLDNDLKSLTFSTLFGGSNSDYGEASVSVKKQTLIITGTTHSADFPTTSGAFQTTKIGSISCDAPVVYAINKLCFVTEPVITAAPLYFCDTTPQVVTFKGQRTVGICNSDTTNVVIKWTKGYQRTPIGFGDSLSILLKINDTIFAQSVDTTLLCQSKEFMFITNFITSTINKSICQGQSYYWNGANRSITGIYKDTFKTGLNCDSIVILKLNVIIPINTSISQYICQGRDSVLWNGVYRKASGTYKDTFPSAIGCDSIVSLNIAYILKKYTTINDTICQGDSILWRGAYIENSGVYKDTLLSSINCDSIVTLNLYFKANLYYNFSHTICAGQTYTWSGKVLDTSGFYYDTLTSSLGCDSINILALTVTPRSYDTFNAIVCEGSSYLWNGNSLTNGGYYPDTFININGCDSISVLHLSIAKVQRDTIDTAICQNDIYMWKGNLITESGTYRDTINIVGDCDSFVLLNITVYPIVPNTFIYDTICEGKFIVWNNQTISSSGAYPDTFQNVNNCDSIVILNLYVVPTIYTSIDRTICATDSSLWNGVYQHSTGVYSDTFTSIKGCDSVAKLYLTVLPAFASNFNISICQGQSYLWNGILRTSSGNYADTFISIQGCDSIVTLNLNVTPKPKVIINTCFASSGGYSFFGKFLTASGIYFDSTNYGNICDTVYELHLEKIDTIYKIRDTFSCNSLLFNGTTYTQNDSQTKIIYSRQGCDSVITKYYIHISHITPKPILQTRYFCDTFLYNGKSYSANKKFYETFRTYAKPYCDSTYNTYSYIKFPKPNIWLTDTQHLSMIRGNSISVEVNGANRYEWSTGETSTKINLSPTHNQVYYVKGWNEYCLDSISFKITVFSDKCRIEFPTAFTPNGDGNNDIYIGRSFEGSKIIEFKVFNRLGQLLFFSTDENFGWDGYYKGELQNSEPYYYTYIATSCVPGKYQTGDGNFMLLR